MLEETSIAGWAWVRNGTCLPSHLKDFGSYRVTPRAFEGLSRAPGTFVCRIQVGDGKVLWEEDARHVLQEFRLDCAQKLLETHRVIGHEPSSILWDAVSLGRDVVSSGLERIEDLELMRSRFLDLLTEPRWGNTAWTVRWSLSREKSGNLLNTDQSMTWSQWLMFSEALNNLKIPKGIELDVEEIKNNLLVSFESRICSLGE